MVCIEPVRTSNFKRPTPSTRRWLLSTLHRTARRQRVDDRAELPAGEAQNSRGEVLGTAQRQRQGEAPRRRRRRNSYRCLREHEGLDALDALVLGEDVLPVVQLAVVEGALDLALAVLVLLVEAEVVDA